MSGKKAFGSERIIEKSLTGAILVNEDTEITEFSEEGRFEQCKETAMHPSFVALSGFGK